MKESNKSNNQWTPVKTDVFWNQIGSQHHTFHIYDNEDAFLDLLAGFVGTGINANDCTIVIATSSHLEKLQTRLRQHGLYIDSLIEDEKYVPVSAEKTLARFMVNGLPNEQLFINCISGIIDKSKYPHRHIRVFREMGSMLSIQGNLTASAQLETYWSKYQRNKYLSFFCAYPKKQLITEDCSSLKEIGFQHSKLVTNSHKVFELLYRNCTHDPAS